MKTLLRYAGGKSKAIRQITPFVHNYDKIVSPFLGETYDQKKGSKYHGQTGVQESKYHLNFKQ